MWLFHFLFLLVCYVSRLFIEYNAHTIEYINKRIEYKSVWYNLKKDISKQLRIVYIVLDISKSDGAENYLSNGRVLERQRS